MYKDFKVYELSLLFYMKIRNKINYIKLFLSTKRYRRRISKIEKDVFSKDVVNAVFFTSFPAMWKYDSLFQEMLKSPFFNPIIVSYSYPFHSIEEKKRLILELEKLFKKKNYPFIKGYDVVSQQLFDVSSLNPDIIFYTQPYDVGYKETLISAFKNRCLFSFTSYSGGIEVADWFYKAPLLGYCWRCFFQTDYHMQLYKKSAIVDVENAVVVGFPISDSFVNDNDTEDPWKIKDRKIKRIIWAPHHSICSEDILNYSNFLELAYKILALAESYKDKIQIAFKPHPVLRRKLENENIWGIKKTAEYYESWDANDNTFLADGDYISLFRTSDAMFHDSSSFTAEYIFFNKPVMYITKGNMKGNLNTFGEDAFNAHYHGSTIEDIFAFIEDVVLGGNDSMYSTRANFLKKYGINQNAGKVGQLMFNEFITTYNLYHQQNITRK